MRATVSSANRGPIALIAALLAALALAACGGSGPTTGPEAKTSTDDPEAEIAEVLNSIFTTSDPKQCTQQVTTRELRRLLPRSTPAGELVSACEKALDADAEARSIKVSDISVDGPAATAQVVPKGGTYAGTVVTVAMVDRDGWRFDGIDDLEVRDRDAYLDAFDEQAANSFGSDSLSRKGASCVAAYIRGEISTARLERSAVSGDRGVAYEAIGACVGGGSDLVTITLLVRNQLKAAGLSSSQADCIAGLAIKDLGGKVTLRAFAEDPKVKGRYERTLKENVRTCA